MLWLMYFTNSTGGASAESDKAIKELKESADRYRAVNFMRINIDLDCNQCQTYEIKNVPCIYAGRDKVFEYKEGMQYDEIKEGVRVAMERFVNDALL